MKNSLLFIDLETIAPQDRKPDPDMVEPPGNYKNPDTIKAYQEAKADEVYRKLSLNPLWAQVIVISAAYGDEETVTFFSDDEEDLFISLDRHLSSVEREPVKSTKDLIKQSPDTWTIVGYNIREFDAPILFLRAKKYGCKNIERLLRDLSRYDRRIEDVMQMALPTMGKQYLKMDELCKFFGIEGKGDIDGSNVYDYYLQGKLGEIADYCKKDVERTRELYNILK